MTFERPRRASIRLNSLVSPVSFVVSARVMRTASRGSFNPGTDAAAPINPGQSVGWSLGQRLARFARSNWSALIDMMVSVSCGSHSRPRGDWKTTSSVSASRTRTEKALSKTSVAPVCRFGSRACSALPGVATVDLLPAGGDVPGPTAAGRLEVQRPLPQDADRYSNRLDFFALRPSGGVSARRGLLLVAHERCHSIFGRALRIRFAFALYFFLPQKALPPPCSASPWPDALHPRYPSAPGQVLHALPEDALAAR